MTKEQMELLVEESIALELLVADLYLLFSREIAADRDFWWQLAVEEKNHAALLKSGRDTFLQVGCFPEELLAGSVAEVSRINALLRDLLARLGHGAPSRAEALRIGCLLEESAGEAHFQTAMSNSAPDNRLVIFQQLNQDDRNHARRIRGRMELAGIEPGPPHSLSA
jgi:hypothetical protein